MIYEASVEVDLHATAGQEPGATISSMSQSAARTLRQDCLDKGPNYNTERTHWLANRLLPSLLRGELHHTHAEILLHVAGSKILLPLLGIQLATRQFPAKS